MFVWMMLSEINRKYLRELKLLYSDNEAAQITSLAFDALANVKREDVIKEPSRSLSSETLQILEDALIRLKGHEPIQHVTGETWFCNLKLKVSSAVLVPRPETEELVSLASTFIEDNDFAVLDIGTGSGCIAIALKMKHKNINCIAVDVSEDALLIARHNANDHDCEIEFRQLDFLDEAVWPAMEKVHGLISNPPYIPDSDKNLLDKNVTDFEPHAALFEPPGQPLIFYHKIAKFGINHLRADGKIFVEIHEDFGKQVEDIFSKAGYNAELVEDMFGKERFVVARKVEPQRH